VTLNLSYVAECDACGEAQMLHTRAIHDAESTLRTMGWRKVVDTGGLEYRCGLCMERLDHDTQARLLAKARGEYRTCKVTRPRSRPGYFPCRTCGDMFGTEDMIYRPFAKEHPLNIVCVPCGADAARRRGYQLPEGVLTRREDAPPTPEPSQLVEF
jgi:hypothetical protein